MWQTVGLYGAFAFTVVLMVTTAYFLMGGLPLLVLKHDVPIDARFIRGFFNAYYQAALWTALGAALSFALWGRYRFALGDLAMAALTLLLRHYLLDAMARLGERIAASDPEAIARFRRVHAAALCANLLQLALLVWGLLRLSRELAAAG